MPRARPWATAQAAPTTVRAWPLPSRATGASAFAVPADVTYSALVSDRWGAVGAPQLTGSWMVAPKVLSYDYLWNEVRVVGGAYGVGFSTTRTGASSFFSSFRDPHVAETLDRFRASSEWLSGFRPSEDEFEGYVVSTAASFDKPLKPRELVRRRATMHMTGYTRQEFLRRRQEVLDASAGDVRALAPALRDYVRRGSCLRRGQQGHNRAVGSGFGRGRPARPLICTAMLRMNLRSGLEPGNQGGRHG